VLKLSADPVICRKGIVLERLVKWGAVSLLLSPLVIAHAAGLLRQERTFDTTANPRIVLSNLMGQVVIKGWDRQQAHVIYSTTSPLVSVDIDQLPLDGAAEKLHLTTRVLSPQATGVDKTVSYSLDVPMDASVEIRNNEGRVEIEKLQGDALLDSSGGAISVADIAGRVVANSIDGSIEILRSTGKIEATSICGDLRFVGAKGSALRAQTTSGKIVYEGDFMADGEYSFRNYSGNIDLFLPPSASFELNRTLVRGNFVSDIPISSHPRRRYSPSGPHVHTFLGTNVSSTAAVKLSSYSGNVRIHRQN